MALAEKSRANAISFPRAVVRLVWATALLLVLLLQVFIVLQVMRQRRAGSPDNLGNGPKTIARLPRLSAQKQEFRFAVVGDVNRGIATFGHIMARLRDAGDLSFLVLLGDCANDPTREDHAYFRQEFVKTGQTLPTFIVAGNHDLAPGSFPRRDFEDLYGPLDFSFTYGNCLFIGLGAAVLHDLQDEALGYLEKVLAEARSGAGHVFVFTHFPPIASLRTPAEGLFTRPERFIQIFDRYAVDYVISGHHHQLGRTRSNATTYLISGGGGARLHDEGYGGSGLFHHALVFRVNADSIDEQLFRVPAAGGIEKYLKKAERGLTRTVWPWEQQHPILTLSMILAVMLSLLATLQSMVLARRQARREVATAGGALAAGADTRDSPPKGDRPRR